MKKPLQAILIAGEEMKEQVLNGTKNITIREGYRNYDFDNVLIGCHLLNWATMKKITKLRFIALKDATKEEYQEDGFETQEDLLKGLQKFYPNITLDSDVTVVKWE